MSKGELTQDDPIGSQLEFFHYQDQRYTKARKTSETDVEFPFQYDTVVVLVINEDKAAFANKTGDKLALLKAMKPGDIALAAWPGKWLEVEFI